MLSNIFWVLMIIVSLILLIIDLDTLVTITKVNKLQRKLYEAKLDAIVSQTLLNIAKANEIVKEDK